VLDYCQIDDLALSLSRWLAICYLQDNASVLRIAKTDRLCRTDVLRITSALDKILSLYRPTYKLVNVRLCKNEFANIQKRYPLPVHFNFLAFYLIANLTLTTTCNMNSKCLPFCHTLTACHKYTRRHRFDMGSKLKNRGHCYKSVCSQRKHTTSFVQPNRAMHHNELKFGT